MFPVRWSRRTVLLTITLVALLVVAAGLVWFVQNQPIASAERGPRLSVDRERIDLGDQKLGDTVHAVFHLQNVGDETLTLNAPRTAILLAGC